MFQSFFSTVEQHLLRRRYSSALAAAAKANGASGNKANCGHLNASSSSAAVSSVNCRQPCHHVHYHTNHLHSQPEQHHLLHRNYSHPLPDIRGNGQLWVLESLEAASLMSTCCYSLNLCVIPMSFSLFTPDRWCIYLFAKQTHPQFYLFVTIIFFSFLGQTLLFSLFGPSKWNPPPHKLNLLPVYNTPLITPRLCILLFICFIFLCHGFSVSSSFSPFVTHSSLDW